MFIELQIIHVALDSFLSLCFVKYTQHRKVFLINFVNLCEIQILVSADFFLYDA